MEAMRLFGTWLFQFANNHVHYMFQHDALDFFLVFKRGGGGAWMESWFALNWIYKCERRAPYTGRDWIPELEGDGAPKMGIDWIHEKRGMVAS